MGTLVVAISVVFATVVAVLAVLTFAATVVVLLSVIDAFIAVVRAWA